MPDPNPPDAHRPGAPDDRPATPRWVKAFAVILALLAATFVALHLSGQGLGAHLGGPP